MRTEEKNLWQWLKNGADSLEDIHMQRIENVVKKNTPDVEGTYKKRSFVIELKSINKVYELRKKLTAGQAMFLYKRWSVGGSAWLLVEVEGLRRYLIPGLYAVELLYPVKEKTLAVLSACTSPQASAVEMLEAIHDEIETRL